MKLGLGVLLLLHQPRKLNILLVEDVEGLLVPRELVRVDEALNKTISKSKCLVSELELKTNFQHSAL